MNAGRFRIGWLAGLAGVALAAPIAHAQQTTPAPSPSPTPAPSRTPSVFTLPGVVPERFSLGSPTATPTVPAPAPTPTPTPSAATPAPATAAPPRRPLSTPAAPPAARQTPAPVGASASPTPAPVYVPAPAPAPLATAPVAVEPVPQSANGSPWFWALLGAFATALGAIGLWLFLRRRAAIGREAETPPVPVSAPVPPPAPPLAPPPGLKPPAPAFGEPFEIALNPLRAEIGAQEIVLELELLIGNRQTVSAENVRVALALMSANPQQDAVIAGFHTAPQGEPAGPPFDLPAGGGGRMPVRLTLPRELVHVVDIGGRPIVVPMVLVDLRWRSGLSIRRFGADFMVGTAGQGGKLGPLRLDRASPAVPLAATRYAAKAAVAA